MTDYSRYTPEQAKQKIADLRADPKFHERYSNRNADIRNKAIDEMVQLQKQIHGDEPVR